MREERLKVLKMLEEGKISTEDAMKLLSHFPEDDATPKTASEKTKTVDEFEEGIQNVVNWAEELGEKAGSWGEDFGEKMGAWGDEFAEKMTVWADDFADKVASGKKPKGMFGFLKNIPGVTVIVDGEVVVGKDAQRQEHVTFTSRPLEASEVIHSLRLEGKNAKVKVFPHGENHFSLECRYVPQRDMEQVAVDFVQKSQGNYELVYHSRDVKSMAVTCYVPANVFEELVASSSNAGITVEGITLKHAVLTTSNANITAEQLTVTEMRCQTSNSSIRLNEVVADSVVGMTSNSKIKVNNGCMGRADLMTSNAGIDLVLDPLASGSTRITAKTSNGGIKVYLPKVLSEDQGVSVATGTSFGKTKNEVGYLVDMGLGHTFQSEGFEGAKVQTVLQLQTSNASIKIQ